ncbi:hypothetical protein ACJX0J_041354, partial [Zea mays]
YFEILNINMRNSLDQIVDFKIHSLFFKKKKNSKPYFGLLLLKYIKKYNHELVHYILSHVIRSKSPRVIKKRHYLFDNFPTYLFIGS